MLGLSFPEILFLAALALVVIGPKQLPEVARTLGRILNELKRASSSLTDEFRDQLRIDNMHARPAPPPLKPKVEEESVAEQNAAAAASSPPRGETKSDPGSSQT